MQDLYFRVLVWHIPKRIDEHSSKCLCLHLRLGGVGIGDEEGAEQGFTRGDGQREMVEPGSFPCRVQLLPLPYVMLVKGGVAYQK